MKFTFVHCLSVLIALSIAGCEHTSDDNTIGQLSKHKEVQFHQVKSRLFKDYQSGTYYFRFMHVEPGLEPVERFVALQNIYGDTITDVNESAFKRIFGFYVDGNYIFQPTNQFEMYEVHTSSIDSIEQGCYFANSDYRVINNSIQYFVGRGILECRDSPTRIVEYPISDTAGVRIVEVAGNDCAVVDGGVLVNGCWLEDSQYLDTSLHDEILSALAKEGEKAKHCFNIQRLNDTVN